MPDKRTPSRITMRTLAEQLGVTRATVSMSLRDHPAISPTTRNRVKKLADELGYRPDPAIAANAASHWKSGSPKQFRTVAFLCNQPGIRDSYPMGYLEPAKKRAAEYGYKVEPFFVDKYSHSAELETALHEKDVRALLIPQITTPCSKTIMEIDWGEFTAVCCGVGRVRPPLHTVSDNMFINTRILWKIAVEAGFKRIGPALHRHDPPAEDDWKRLGATLAAIKIHNIPKKNQIPPMLGPFDNDEAVFEWYQKHQPEVIIAFNQSTVHSLQRKGVRFPQDCEALLLMTDSEQQWSGFIRPFEPIARSAVDLLVSELRHNKWGLPNLPQTTLITPEWNKGASFTREITALQRFLKLQGSQLGNSAGLQEVSPFV